MEHKTNLHKTGFQSQNNNFFNSKNYPPSNLPEVQYFQQNDNHQHQSTRILPNRTSLNYNQNFNYTQANDLNAGNRNFYQDTNASRNPFPSSSSLQVPNVQNQGYSILQKESTYQLLNSIPTIALQRKKKLVMQIDGATLYKFFSNPDISYALWRTATKYPNSV